MRTLFGNYGITDWDIHKDDIHVNLDKYLGDNQIDVASLYPKHFEILTTNPYWSKHPILENYRKYESEQWKTEKEKYMNYTTGGVERTLKLIGEIKQLKVFTEVKNNKYIEAYFIDPFHLKKTLFVKLNVEELGFGWASTADEFIREHFNKNNPVYTSTDLEFKEYCKEDILITRAINKAMQNSTYDHKGEHKPTYTRPHLPKIKDVKFNGPATIVFWSDDTKTVVKAQDEEVDYEKGLAMAIAKKALGNKGNYFNEFKKWLPEEEEETAEITLELEGGILEDITKNLKEAFCPKNMEFKFKVKEID